MLVPWRGKHTTVQLRTSLISWCSSVILDIKRFRPCETNEKPWVFLWEVECWGWWEKWRSRDTAKPRNNKNNPCHTIHVRYVRIFSDIYHKNQPNVGKYTMHGWYGQGLLVFMFGVDQRKIYQ